jgi:homoserine kinase
MKHISLSVPATSANLGPGFDTLGLAVSLWNDVTLIAEGSFSRTKTRHVQVEIAGAGVDSLPRDATNVVVRAAFQVFAEAHRWPAALRVILVNRIPVSRGLGSSSAAIVGGLAAANRLLDNVLSQERLIEMAVRMEGHADNVVPAFLGNICACTVIDGRPHYWSIPAPSDLQAVVCVPELLLPTKKARAVLPKKVALKDAVFTAGHVALLLGAFSQKRYDWLAEAMDDVLHQPARARLVPGLFDVIKEAREAGAYGAALSGAGSCVLALAPKSKAARIGEAMHEVFKRRDVQSQILSLTLEKKGIRVKS